MLKISTAVALIFFSFSTSYAATYPFQPILTAEYSKSNIKSESQTRLRLAVSIDGSAPEENIKVGDIVVCSSHACYRPQLQNYSNYVNVGQTNNGTASVLFDMILPYDNIKSIYFGDVVGQKIISGKVDLPSPLSLEKGFQGGDIMVILKKTQRDNREIFAPINAVSNLIDDGAKAVYYNPRYSSTIKLAGGTSMYIPAGALAQPQIFSIDVRDTGNEIPSIDIFPSLEMEKEFKVSVTPQVEQKRIESISGYISIPTTPSIGTGQRLPESSARPVPTTKTFKKTGLLKFSQVTATDPQHEIKMASSDGGAACAAILSNPTNQNVITQLMPQAGVVNVNWCENLEPNIHIFVANRKDSRIKFSLIGSTASFNYFNLLPINHVTNISGSIVNVNGFYWLGDMGIGQGQGKAAGYVSSKGTIIGWNYFLNEMGTQDGPGSAGLKYVFASTEHGQNSLWEERSEILGYKWDVAVSSSTSIVKNGTCTSDQLKSRWSAIGESNGLMMIISSTSDGETNAANLCKIFKAMNIQNAIRLDGGPSAGVTSGGILKNPLTGLARIKYGSVRYVAYGLKIGI